MRYFFIAVKDILTLNNISNITLLTPETAQRYAIQVPGEYPDNELLLNKYWEGTIRGEKGTWQVWQLSSVSNDREKSRSLFRLLSKTLDSEEVLGPWGLPQLKRLNISDDLTVDKLSMLISGDKLDEESIVDYSPTKIEIEKNIDSFVKKDIKNR